jgi:hypothetical protein
MITVDDDNDDDDSIQFNSYLYFRANLTAQKPITG